MIHCARIVSKQHLLVLIEVLGHNGHLFQHMEMSAAESMGIWSYNLLPNGPFSCEPPLMTRRGNTNRVTRVSVVYGPLHGFLYTISLYHAALRVSSISNEGLQYVV
jgi:hypothetical protein